MYEIIVTETLTMNISEWQNLNNLFIFNFFLIIIDFVTIRIPHLYMRKNQ